MAAIISSPVIIKIIPCTNLPVQTPGQHMTGESHYAWCTSGNKIKPIVIEKVKYIVFNNQFYEEKPNLNLLGMST